jgi:hypothetical protein
VQRVRRVNTNRNRCRRVNAPAAHVAPACAPSRAVLHAVCLLPRGGLAVRWLRGHRRASAPQTPRSAGVKPRRAGHARGVARRSGAPLPAPSPSHSPCAALPAYESAPGWSGPAGTPLRPAGCRARLSPAQPAALTLAARRRGRRARSSRCSSACGSVACASAPAPSAGAARPGARGARALALDEPGRRCARGTNPARSGRTPARTASALRSTLGFRCAPSPTAAA